MTQIDAAAAKLEREDAALERIGPRLAELRYLLGTTTGDPDATPDDWQAELDRLQLERRAVAGNISETRRELGMLEQKARSLQSRIDDHNREKARLEAIPETTPRAASEIARLIVEETRIRDSLQITLDAIGTPRDLAVEVA